MSEDSRITLADAQKPLGKIFSIGEGDHAVNEAGHRCHFPGCATPTPRKWLYCKPHWFTVPAPIRRRVWAAYEALPHGVQGNCLRVSKEWIKATRDAEAAVKMRAGT